MTNDGTARQEPLALWTETLERLLRLRTGRSERTSAPHPVATVWIAPPHLPELLTRRTAFEARDISDQAA